MPATKKTRYARLDLIAVLTAQATVEDNLKLLTSLDREDPRFDYALETFEDSLAYRATAERAHAANIVASHSGRF